MSRIRRILHPSDFSRACGPAFAQAVDLAKANRAELLVLHVLGPVIPMTSDRYASPKVYGDLEASTRAYCKTELDALVAKATKAGVRAKAMLVDGSAHERIVHTARSKRVDLIVIGTHGHSGLARLFLGSVAGRVVATATCPVMTIRAK